jgi:hypothetical protein
VVIAAQTEALLFDVVSECDGLERLIVIGVGLDSVVDDQPKLSEVHKPTQTTVQLFRPLSVHAYLPYFGQQQPAGSVALETRSMIYRAMTRAQLMVVLVNEFMPGGWLEFLGHVRLRSDQQFDRQVIGRISYPTKHHTVHDYIDQLHDSAGRN